jgi:hypothetical protein
MADTNKLIAAIFAAAMCTQSNENKHEDYLKQYHTFLKLMTEREEAEKTKKAAAQASFDAYKKPGTT